MTRDEAHKSGEPQYTTGRPCSKGHNAPRYTTSGACVQCVKGYQGKYKKEMKLQAGAGKKGQVAIQFYTHRDDIEAIEAYATALAFDRRQRQDAAFIAGMSDAWGTNIKSGAPTPVALTAPEDLTVKAVIVHGIAVEVAPNVPKFLPPAAKVQP